MDSVVFGLKLDDAVTAPAKRMASALKSVSSEAKKTAGSLDFGKEVSRLEDSLKKLTRDPKGFVAGEKLRREVREQRKKLLEDAGLRKKEGFFEGLFKFASPYGSGRVISNVLGEMMADGIEKGIDVLLEGAKKFVEVIGEGIGKAFEESGKQETLRIGEKLSLGKGAGEFREDVGRFSKLTGFDDDMIRGMLLKTRRAGFDQQSARTAFAAATDVAAGEGQGGNAGRVQELMSAFEHIKLKGGVQERLLPNLGVDVKGFYADLAKSLKVGVGTAKKMAEEGKVDPQLLLNTIFKGIEAKQGGKLGTGAIAYSKTFEARLAKVKNLPNEYLKGLVDSPAFARASEMLGHLLDALDPESATGHRIMASLEKAFGRIGDLLQDPEGLVNGIADGIEGLVGLVEQLLPNLKEMGSLLAGAAQTTADLVNSARLYAAIVSGDKEGAAAIMKESTQARLERVANKMAADNAAHDTTAAAVNVAAASVGLPISATSTPGGARGGKVIHMSVNAPVTVHGADDETAKKTGRAIHREMVNAHERAAQEGG